GGLSPALCGLQAGAVRVVGGTDVAPGRWPWQVSVCQGSQHRCGGSVLAPEWILTAAHCVHRYPGLAAPIPCSLPVPDPLTEHPGWHGGGSACPELPVGAAIPQLLEQEPFPSRSQPEGSAARPWRGCPL
uniref:Peptidase S1 domain-containing protein n=1 Tax=Cyanoderma ruficeps TaxID=181631 RepID=A0A8C3QIE4_9PASS